METCFVARDNSGVLTVKLRRETSLVAYSTDKRSNTLIIFLNSVPKIMAVHFVNFCQSIVEGVHGKISTRLSFHIPLYSEHSPCDHSHKRPALVTTTFVKPRLKCH